MTIPPLRVYNECVEKMENFAKFKLKCIKSEIYWKNAINKSVYNEDKSDRDTAETDLVHITIKEEGNENDYPECESSLLHNSTKQIESSRSEITLDHKQKSHECTTCKRKFKYSKCFINHKCLNKKLGSNETNIDIQENKKGDQIIKVAPSPILQDTTKKEVENTCGLCDLCFNNKVELRDHLNKHSENNLFKCEICGYNGPDAAKMISHRFTHISQHVWCHICNRRMKSAKMLEYHYRSVHLQKPGQCPYCGRDCKNYHSWRKHDRLHTVKKMFVCDLCDRRFLYKNQIVAHMIDHSDVREYICEACGKGFKRPATLRMHMESVHKPNKPVTCDHCNRRFKNENKLSLHLKRLHDEKPYQCPICLKRYRLECYLRYHMFWHTGEKPHVCEICGLKYKQRAHLNVHMRKHTGERPHKCNICGKEFATPQQAKRHTNVHSSLPQHMSKGESKR
ncbi:zinc finger protein 664-like isoform X2 [Aricia agestis]|nr:zinc finger protein 664-like isoform X2 [Aricia agestis]